MCTHTQRYGHTSPQEELNYDLLVPGVALNVELKPETVVISGHCQVEPLPLPRLTHVQRVHKPNRQFICESTQRIIHVYHSRG